MSILKIVSAYAPILSVALVASCIGITLGNFTAPVYEVRQPEADGSTIEENKLPEECEAEEIEPEDEAGAPGAFDLDNGTYEGTGMGFAGPIRVSVEIRDKRITDIQILKVEADDAAFFNRAKGVIDKIIKAQSFDVDVVSGATYSSKGIISAVKNALTGETDKTTAEPNERKNAAVSPVKPGRVADADAYKDGIYYGSAAGFAGPIRVRVEISGGKIASVTITDTADGSGYIRKASALIAKIISSQSTNVDTVSGATYSSAGIIQAVRNALSKAAINHEGSSGNNTDDNEQDDTDDGENLTGRIPYLDGIYYGTGEGYLGDLTVAVVIQDKTIKAILITEAEDDEAFLNRALAVAANIVKQQDTEVDIVSGATYSSNGILEAVKNALAEAERVTNGEPGVPGDEDEKPGDETGGGDDKGETGNQGKDDEGKGDSPETVYADGDYVVSVLCVPDEYADFEQYNLLMTVTVKDDRITVISGISGDGDPDNDSYINRAVNGTSKITGVVAQIIEKGVPEEIDTVSRATCSSQSIISGCIQALENARRNKDEGDLE